MRVWSGVLLVVASCRAPVGHRLDGPLFTQPPLPACAAAFCGVEARAALDLPHQGFESFHHTASALPLESSPRARVSYARFWWDELEPAPGELNFALLDDALEAAAAEGQTFAFRVMAEESRDGARRVPAWLAAAAGGTWGVHQNGARCFSPDYDSPAFLEAVERTVTALGARYDGDPRLERVEVGFVGDAGEWATVVSGAALPSHESALRVLGAFARAFPRTPVLMQVGAVSDEGRPLASALAQGMGWRLDCWGDIGSGWNHHDDFYEQRLAEADAGTAWQRAPVGVETCGDMESWDLVGFDEAQVRWVLRWALDHHVSVINNKSRRVPARFRPVVDEYLGFAGPRYFVASASWSADTVTVRLLNRGTTPAYRPWRLALREAGGAPTFSTTSLEGWTEALDVTFAAGPGALEVAVVDERGVPLPFANEGVAANGWLPLR